MWCDMMWCDMIWCDMIWCDMIWLDMKLMKIFNYKLNPNRDHLTSKQLKLGDHSAFNDN